MEEMNTTPTNEMTLGLDIGALGVKLALLDGKGALLRLSTRAHRGEIQRVVLEMLRELPAGLRPARFGLVGQNAALLGQALGLKPDNQAAATIAAVRRDFPGARRILDIGGGSLSVIELTPKGEFASFQTNTACAAGTGSFLDEQATRLGLDYEAMAALPDIADPPSVAARCAVFAKSDLIHRQQEGYSKAEMWAGLCKGLARTIVMTLFKGRKPTGQSVLVGGVAKNRAVVRALTALLPDGLVVLPSAEGAGALGAALLAKPLEAPLDLSRLEHVETSREHDARRPALTLTRSSYPSFEVSEATTDELGNEIRVTRWPATGPLRGYLGIDIGSTSTKLLMIDEREEVLLDIYRKTGGDPLAATKKLFRALRALAARHGSELEILGVGTTGSGRKLVGTLIGADRVVNEITAHVVGTMKVDPSVDTIFEIGGQDAKYIHAVNGRLHSANMNYVCAAGTGSFVEEISRKLGFDLFTLGDEVQGVVPPFTSDRCTVFMDQDARLLLRRGYAPREVMGAVLYSVVQNYLNKVVGTRHVSKTKVFFQGATARNKGLVAAFENLLGVEVVVSPYCHVMGCYGVALNTKHQMEQKGERTRFVGLGFADRDVRLSQEPCRLCANHCAISYAEVEGQAQRPSWGYLCGRDPEETHMRPNREFELFRLRERLWQKAGELPLPEDAPRIGLPRALVTYSTYPLWRRLFARLGYRLVLSPVTTPEIAALSSDWVGADYCHPVKLAHGHLRHLLEVEKVERVFAPYMIHAGKQNEKTTEAYFCPYNIALPAMLGSAIHLNGLDEERLLRATLDLRWNDATAAERLFGDLGRALKVTKAQMTQAWREARETQHAFEAAIREEGRKRVAELLQGSRPAIVILGRPYNTYDPGANLALPEKIARLGFPVIPLEFLPLQEEPLGAEFKNMFWNYGRKIMEALRIVARTPNLYAVYFSNFSCGPDAFIQTYAEEVMGDKPLLMLELDEHGADAGYLTRLEAFADVLAVNRTQTVPTYGFTTPPVDTALLKQRTLWVPHMGEGHPIFFAAALRGAGLDARALPLETVASFQKGRRETRGGECVPCPATFGAFMTELENSDTPERQVLFMPTAEGPCRFGQYCTQNRIALNRHGLTEVPIVSWSSSDTYDGVDGTTRRWLWTALVLGDVLFKLRCRILPYEIRPGETEEVYRRWITQIEAGIAARTDLKPLMSQAKEDFAKIPVRREEKPLVGIVGEIYVRNNRFTNQDLVRRVEQAGGEAWLAPLSEWILYTAHMESWSAGYRQSGIFGRLGSFVKNQYLAHDEAAWMKLMSPLLDARHEPSVEDTLKAGSRFVPLDFEGETILTLGRTLEFVKEGASLVINCAPFACMPGAITSGVLQRIQAESGVPMASLFYDGEGAVNDVIDTYLSNLSIRHSAKGGRHDALSPKNA